MSAPDREPASDWTNISAITRRGFTGHEHLDNVGLIHMNGRVYQPSIGRFLSSDPLIDAAQGTQAFNRYAYLGNGPLSGIDPSGFLEQLGEVIVTAPRWPPGWNPSFISQRGWILMQHAGSRSIVRPREPPPPKAKEVMEENESQGNQDEPCTESTLGEAVARNTTWSFGGGLGLGGKLFGIINVELFHAYGGTGGNFAGQRWNYISGGGPAVEAKLGVVRVGFSTGAGQTEWGQGSDSYFEESSEHAFLGITTDVGTLQYGNRLHVPFIDLGISPDLGQIWRDWRCKKN